MKKVLTLIISIVLAIGSLATFAACGASYTITYYIDGVVAENAQVTKYKKSGTAIDLWMPSEEGKTFDGWYNTDKRDGVQMFVIATNSTGNREFHGKFFSDTYNITYVVDGGETNVTGKSDTYNYSKDNATMLWIPQLPEGYVLNGWFENPDYTGTRFAQLSAGADGDKTYYASVVDKDSAENYYEIEYYIDGVKVEDAFPNDYFYSENALQLYLPSYNRQILGFDGWYSNDSYTGNANIQLPAKASGNKKYYGRYVEPEGYSYNKIKMPNFTLDNTNGTKVSLDDFYGKKPVVINFWFATCRPCIDEMPYFQELYLEYGDKIEYIMINGQDDKDTINKFVGDNKYTFPCYIGKNTGIVSQYSIYSYPTTFVVDRWGYRSYRMLGGISKQTLKTEFDIVLNKA